jgi:hypothetical protein
VPVETRPNPGGLAVSTNKVVWQCESHAVECLLKALLCKGVFAQSLVFMRAQHFQEWSNVAKTVAPIMVMYGKAASSVLRKWPFGCCP